MIQQFQLLFRRILIAILSATACRILFFVFQSYFHQFSVADLLQAFIYGLLYDLSACIYVHSLFIVLHLMPGFLFYKKSIQNFLFFLFMMGQFLILFFNLMDTGYYTFSGKRSGIEIFAMRNELDGLVVQYLKDYWYLTLFLFGLSWLNFKFYKSTYSKAINYKQVKEEINWFKEIGFRILLSCALIIGARGGVNLIPLSTFDAARQTRAELISLVVNTPFNMIISTQQRGLKEMNFMPMKEAESMYNPVHFSGPKQVRQGKRNIVLIIVESLGKEYVGFYNNGKGYTPFLDSLMQHSEVFLHAYSNGKKSIEGIPAILSAMPSWMQIPYLESFYQSNAIPGIGNYLGRLGYDASFYHGGKNGTMSFDNYIAVSGNGKYFGKNEYPDPNDFDSHWGIYDRPYLAYFAKELSAKPEPFFSTMFTLSSHHPYSLPEKLKDSYPQGTLAIHKTIAYADDALRNFFVLAQKESWFKNTTFIITADHSADNETAYYESAAGEFEVPLFIYRPDQTAYSAQHETVSHNDILPFVMNEVCYPQNYFSYGTALQHNVNMQAALQFRSQYYQLIKWPYVYQFDGKTGLGFYNLKTDSLMRNNALKDATNMPQIDSLDKMVKAMIQVYNYRLIHNKSME